MPQPRRNATVIAEPRIDWGSDAMFPDRLWRQLADRDFRAMPTRFGRTLAVQVMSACLSLRRACSPATWRLDIVAETR